MIDETVTMILKAQHKLEYAELIDRLTRVKYASSPGYFFQDEAEKILRVLKDCEEARARLEGLEQ